MTALEMRRAAELRYDGPIPAEVLAAIDAQDRTERAARPRVTAEQAAADLAKLQVCGPVFRPEPTLSELNARYSAYLRRQQQALKVAAE